MPDHRPIALVFSYSLDYCRSVLKGVRRFARQRDDWLLVPVMPRQRLEATLKNLRPRGVIAHIFNRTWAGPLKRLNCPVVNVSGAFPNLEFPRVGINEPSIGVVAARHFVDQGLRHFAYVGPARDDPAGGRHEGFRRKLARLLPNHTFAAWFTPMSRVDPTATDPGRAGIRLRRWLRGLPKPVGVLAHTDAWGLWFSEFCREAGIVVPQDAAILGVDNDDLLCELAQPSLSSIDIPAERVGYEAAELLQRLLDGRRAPRHPQLLEPLGVIARQSTDLLAVDDPTLAEAIQIIRARYTQPFTILDILREIPVSRRSLERRFRAALGHGPSEEIRRLRLERAKMLLIDTNLQMPALAAQSGFSSAKMLSLVFSKRVGIAPTRFRRNNVIPPRHS